MKKNNQYSLYLIITTVVLSVVISIMSISLTYNYYNTKNKLTNDLHKELLITLSRLKNSIVPFISSYSINEYEKLIINEMSNKNILYIVVEDYHTAKIIGKNTFYVAKKRDKNWNSIDYNPAKEIVNSYFSMNESPINYKGKELGKIKVYFTDKFLLEELKLLIINNIIMSILISLFLIISLFLAIHIFILKPMNKIISTLADKDEKSLPKSFNIQKGSKEITSLSFSILSMIHKIKISQKKIDKLNERFELTLDSVEDGIWDWNIKRDTAYFSKQWKLMLGYENNEIKNNSSGFLNLLHNNDKDRVKESLKKHFSNPKKYPFNIEIQMKCKNGDFKWILSRGKVHFDKNNNPVRMLGYHTDITKKKANEEFQKKQDKIITEQLKLASMGEMIANIAHQWRQPLSIISTGATGMKIQKEFNMLNDDQFNQTCDSINDKDNAGGIPEEVLPQIFEPYFTTKHKFQGTGLGLNMAYKLIAKSMKGTIQAKNETFIFKDTTYIGAKFLIKLPLKKGSELEEKILSK